MAECGQRHETHPDVTCDSTTINHRWCTGWSDEAESYVDWPNPSYVAPKRQTRSDARRKLQEMAARVAPETRTPSDDHGS